MCYNLQEIGGDLMSSFCSETAGIWKVIGFVIYIIRIAIPIIIVLLGTLDLGKAVIAGEDKKIKESQKSFLLRLVYGIAIFFVFNIVYVIFGLLGLDLNSGAPRVCWQCATKPNGSECESYIKDVDFGTIDGWDGQDSGPTEHSSEEA